MALEDSGFPKERRLLTSADYTAVFSDARIKVSCRHFLILARANHQSARLGLVVAKKNVAKATQRNRIKRVIRESFRHERTSLGGLDIIVLVRSDTGRLTNASMFSRLSTLWRELEAKTQQHAV